MLSKLSETSRLSYSSSSFNELSVYEFSYLWTKQCQYQPFWHPPYPYFMNHDIHICKPVSCKKELPILTCEQRRKAASGRSDRNLLNSNSWHCSLLNSDTAKRRKCTAPRLLKLEWDKKMRARKQRSLICPFSMTGTIYRHRCAQESPLGRYEIGDDQRQKWSTTSVHHTQKENMKRKRNRTNDKWRMMIQMTVADAGNVQ